MQSMESFLKARSFTVHNISYNSLGSVEEIQNEIFQAVNDTLSRIGERKVHFVGFSLGGLFVQDYLNRQAPKNLGRVVFIGIPGNGTPLVDELEERWWYRFTSFFHPPILDQLGSRDFVDFWRFNPIYYDLGIIAGSTGTNRFAVELEEENDGYVTVASTKIEGMKDHVVLDTDHAEIDPPPLSSFPNGLLPKVRLFRLLNAKCTKPNDIFLRNPNSLLTRRIRPVPLIK